MDEIKWCPWKLEHYFISTRRIRVYTFPTNGRFAIGFCCTKRSFHVYFGLIELNVEWLKLGEKFPPGWKDRLEKS